MATTTSTSFNCTACNSDMNSMTSVMLHIKGKKHSKATAKLEANLVTETNEEVREQLKEILAEGRQLERMSLADLPIAGQKERGFT